jgi:hypothetical protein
MDLCIWTTPTQHERIAVSSFEESVGKSSDVLQDGCADCSFNATSMERHSVRERASMKELLTKYARLTCALQVAGMVSKVFEVCSNESGSSLRVGESGSCNARPSPSTFAKPEA